MRVAVVAEYYPRAADPTFGVWAHRQALAARDAGAEVEVLVLHRPVPSKAALASRDPKALVAPFRQPWRARLDGIEVTYVPFIAPSRDRSYGSWGTWAAPTLASALRRLRGRFAFDLVHAHYAAPGGDAVRRALTLRYREGDGSAPAADEMRAAYARWRGRAEDTTRPRGVVPYVVSVHGGDLLSVAERGAAGAKAVRHGLEGAALVLANSGGMEERARRLGAARTRVVRLGTDVPEPQPSHHAGTIVTVAHLVARKRHADVLRAMWLLRDEHPRTRWVVVGDGPERAKLEALAARLELADRVEFRGAVPHADAMAAAQSASLFVLPSVDEAFGVAYVEAMAGGVPAIGSLGEAGPEEIRATSEGIVLVPPGDPEALARAMSALLGDERERRRLGAAARAAVLRDFTWEACGAATVAAYEAALAG